MANKQTDIKTSFGVHLVCLVKGHCYIMPRHGKNTSLHTCSNCKEYIQCETTGNIPPVTEINKCAVCKKWYGNFLKGDVEIYIPVHLNEDL